nr:MAG: hypothetical protein KatS3mg041_0221 [Bacteroidota bacterium]
MRLLYRGASVALALGVLVSVASGQRWVRYGAEVLRLGAGAEAAGMGQNGLTVRADVTAGYWNPAGLVGLQGPQVGYMHVEQFAGLVQYDYAAVAWGLGKEESLALSLLRVGVDNIKNTLAAWDPERGLPLPERVSTFSAADYALLIGYGRSLRPGYTGGVVFKLLYSRMGPFASAWGVSVDVGLQYRRGPWTFALVATDLTTMARFWYVDAGALEELKSLYGDTLPGGVTELIPPALRMGLRRTERIGPGAMDVVLELDLRPDQAYGIDGGAFDLEPRFGMAYAFRNALLLRVGLEEIGRQEGRWVLSPTAGVGLRVRRFRLDYALGHLLSAHELGVSHRLSAVFSWPPW